MRLPQLFPRLLGAHPLRATLSALFLASSYPALAASFNWVDLATLNEATWAVVRGPNGAGAAVGGRVRLAHGAASRSSRARPARSS